jgi:4-oxalocrotonate tautomerase
MFSKNGRASLKETEEDVPHVIVKLWPGKSEQQKRKLAQEITESVTRILGYGEESVSVGIEEVAAKDWSEEVYGPDIIQKPTTIYKKPGYQM